MSTHVIANVVGIYGSIYQYTHMLVLIKVPSLEHIRAYRRVAPYFPSTICGEKEIRETPALVLSPFAISCTTPRFAI